MSDMSDLYGKAKILIVDDTLINLRLLSSMLGNSGYSVYEATDGRSALAEVQTHTPDLILLDIRLPGMDGYEVCRQIKTDETTRHIPVIFVSALDEQTDKVQGFAVGGVDYITKPFQSKEVLARVETHLTLRNLQRQLESQNLKLQLEISERKRIEIALQQANEELEQRVQARTAELVAANQDLNSELQERKRAEAALRKSQKEKERLLVEVRQQEQQVREIMNTVPEGVFLLDESGRIILTNPLAQADLQALTGMKEGDTLTHLGDKTLPEILEPPPKGLWHELKAAARIFEVIARPTAEGAKKQRWVIVLRDVTSEREIQARSQQQERLAAVGQLAAGIAHDFNNILAVILLYTEMALGTPEISARLRERLLTITQQSKRASDLIQQILDFSRRTMLERHPMDMLPFLKEQVKLLERTLPENIKIDLGYKPGAFIIDADLTRMQQAIMNLAVNARDAMPEGGKLQISLDHPKTPEGIHCIACGKVQGGDWVSISVADNGNGIDPEYLPHIFEPFFTTKAPGHGTGLGLSQVFGIIEKHDGHIDVQSHFGKGTTFQLYLPSLMVQPSSKAETELHSFIRGHGETILVAEDEPTTRHALMEGLTLLNYRVICSTDGLEALNQLQQQPGRVDLILSDVVMPEMGGIALFRAIRSGGSPIPIILMTGHPLQNELDNLLKEGLNAWLMKPPRLKHLATLIAQALSNGPIP
jgi:two-component system, cell cycle sensor histidine kinase and response regulator CckA